jgi:hypothetical protein
MKIKVVYICAIIFYSSALLTASICTFCAVTDKINLKKDAAAILETPNLNHYAKN